MSNELVKWFQTHFVRSYSHDSSSTDRQTFVPTTCQQEKLSMLSSLKKWRNLPRYTECKYDARDELHESEASEASVFCFDDASSEKSCFVDGLVCFISLCLLVFVFLNATRRDRNCPWSTEFAEMKEVSRRSPRELKFVRYIIRLEDLTKSFKWRAYVMSGGVPTQIPCPEANLHCQLSW